MIDEDGLRVLATHAIDNQAARFRRRHITASLQDTWGAEGAWGAYLECIALALGGRYPTGHRADDTHPATIAWRALLAAVDRVLSQAASTLDEPDHDAAVRGLRALAAASASAQAPPTGHPPTMQQRILAAATEAGYDAGCQVTIQPHNRDTRAGVVYFTAKQGFTPRLTLRYDFDDEGCSLHLFGSGIDALQPRSSPPTFDARGPVATRPGWRVSFHHVTYVDGARIEAMVTLLRQALATDPTP